MKYTRTALALAALVAVALLAQWPGAARAQKTVNPDLDKPSAPTVSFANCALTVSVPAVAGANRYTFEIVANYDTNGAAPGGEETKTFEFTVRPAAGTQMVTLTIPVSRLTLQEDTDGDSQLNVFAPISVQVRVRAMRTGKMAQKSPFSEFSTVTTINATGCRLTPVCDDDGEEVGGDS